MAGERNRKGHTPGIRLLLMPKRGFPHKRTLDNGNGRSYNRSVTASAHEIGRNVRMDKEQAKELITGLTYCEKLMLRELLLDLKQKRLPEQSLEESDQKAS